VSDGTETMPPDSGP